MDALLYNSLRNVPEYRREEFTGLYHPKEWTTAFLLCLVLGSVGAHHFYLGNTSRGVLYLIFSLTFIPWVISIIELFLMKDLIRQANLEQIREIKMDMGL